MNAYGTADFSKNAIPLWLVDLKLKKIGLKWIIYLFIFSFSYVALALEYSF